MPHVVIRVTPTDYDAWFQIHSGQVENLRRAGVISEVLCRDTASPSTVVMIEEVEDIPRFMAFMQSPEVQTIIARAPIEAPPTVWALEEVTRLIEKVGA